MAAKPRTQKVERSSYWDYLKKALEGHRTATQSYARGDWNAAAHCAIHCCISASDALCAYAPGLRHAGERHSDAAALLMSITPIDERYKANAVRLRRVIDIKNPAGYEERLVFCKEAEKALMDCERFLSFIISEIPPGEQNTLKQTKRAWRIASERFFSGDWVLLNVPGRFTQYAE